MYGFLLFIQQINCKIIYFVYFLIKIIPLQQIFKDIKKAIILTIKITFIRPNFYTTEILTEIFFAMKNQSLHFSNDKYSGRNYSLENVILFRLHNFTWKNYIKVFTNIKQSFTLKYVSRCNLKGCSSIINISLKKNNSTQNLKVF